MKPWEETDLAILEQINQEWTHPWLDTFFVWLTKPPHEELYFIGAALLLMTLGGKRGRQAVPWIALAVLLADQLTASVIKPWVDRMRPCFAHPEEVRLLMERQARSPSFPSSHAANSFAVALVLFGVHRWLGWAVLGLAVLISYSRPYVGVHYPSDTLTGAALGVLLGGGCLFLQRRVEQWRKARRRPRKESDPDAHAVRPGEDPNSDAAPQTVDGPNPPSTPPSAGDGDGSR